MGVAPSAGVGAGGAPSPGGPRQGSTRSVLFPLSLSSLYKFTRVGPGVLLGAVLAWGLWNLRSTLTPVAYSDDASMHEQMVRFATTSFRDGHDPLTLWFPYLGEGSPQFLHYQSLGAMITGAWGLVLGADSAFRWSLYLLLALWPLAIYWSARILGLGRSAAACAALVSPIVVSAPSVGYEQGAYVWIGYGLWAQLWAMWALPFAWACTWRAMSSIRFVPAAAAAIALTACLHFETGYLAFLGPLLFPWLAWRRLSARLVHAASILVLSVCAAAWVIVPLVAQGRWASLNQPLEGTPLESGYGARVVLGWLVAGRLLDDHRFPVISLLAAVGVLVALVGWRKEPTVRPLLAVLVASLILSFGRTSFGGLVRIVPGSSDLFFRRFMMGAQLAAVLLAGIGMATLLRAALRVGTTGTRWVSHRRADYAVVFRALVGVLALVCGFGLAVGYAQIQNYDGRNTAGITAQHASQATQHTGQATAGAELDPLVDYIRNHPAGRVYAGLPTNWGMDFTVGQVPVFKYLEAEDLDEVGYTLRTASLMTDPESKFNQSNPSDYLVFGVHYLLLPATVAPPVPARRVMVRGVYALWSLPDVGYISIERPVGALDENRADLASKAEGFLSSDLPSHGEGLLVNYGTGSVARSSTPMATARSLPHAAELSSERPSGVITSERVELGNGRAKVKVTLDEVEVVVLAASYDPGWHAQVDGRQASTVMMAPTVVGVRVGSGTHTIQFSYVGFPDYGWLFLLSFGATVFLAIVAFATRQARRKSIGV